MPDGITELGTLTKLGGYGLALVVIYTLARTIQGLVKLVGAVRARTNDNPGNPTRDPSVTTACPAGTRALELAQRNARTKMDAALCDERSKRIEGKVDGVAGLAEKLDRKMDRLLAKNGLRSEDG